MPTPKKTPDAGVSLPAAESKRKRAKATPEIAADGAAQPQTAAPKRPSAARSAAASHKHAFKKTGQPADEAVPVEPSRRVTHEDVARLAYSYWEARGCSGGSPEQDWLRAERELLVAAQDR
jgi:hypothetical protein